jgi:hypothetical protein
MLAIIRAAIIAILNIKMRETQQLSRLRTLFDAIFKK